MRRGLRATARLQDARIHAGVAATIALLSFAVLGPSAAFAAGGGPGGEAAANANVVLPLTPAQAQMRNKKLQMMSQLSVAAPGTAAAATATSAPTKLVLDARARHQYRMYYCGPATIQVLSNLSWGVFNSSIEGQTTSNNKYTQTHISASWAHTTSDSGTTLANLIDGMNGASNLPAGFYSQWHAPEWINFHDAIIIDTYNFGVGMAIGVNPRKLNSIYYLTSWKNNTPKIDIGHYIPLRGYSGSDQSSALAYYDDSSGGQDEVDGTWIAGSTGAFSDLSYTVYMTMMNRNGNMAW
jgi:hypothetical protein